MLGGTREELLQLHVRDTYVPLEKALTQQRLEQIRTEKHVYLTDCYNEKMGRSFRSKSVQSRCPMIAS